MAAQELFTASFLHSGSSYNHTLVCGNDNNLHKLIDKSHWRNNNVGGDMSLIII